MCVPVRAFSFSASLREVACAAALGLFEFNLTLLFCFVDGVSVVPELLSGFFFVDIDCFFYVC